jgi:hypothetical protein
VDGSDVPAVSGQRRGYDGLQRGVGNSGAWYLSRFASRREGGRRLEAVMASGDDELLVPLQNKMIPMN